MKAPLQKEGPGIKDNRSQPKSGRWFTRVSLAAGILLVCGLANGADNGADADGGANFCQQTSQKLLSSCQAGAQSDNLLALGKCANLADAAARKDCKQKAAADQKDARQTCKDQFDARQAVCDRLGETPYDPVIDPKKFVSTIDNPFFPLTPGTTFIYEGQTAAGFEHDEFFVTHNTKKILGVTCIEVRDTSTVDGELTEDTLDWFAQDRDGNVWYFGENAKQLVDGLIVGVEGSWTAGVDGAKPGIVMEAKTQKAHPKVGDFYRQEFALDTAEDVAEVVSLDISAPIVSPLAPGLPPGSFDNCLETKETSPLEPDALENKFYHAGIGNVLTHDISAGETLQLVQIKTGG